MTFFLHLPALYIFHYPNTLYYTTYDVRRLDGTNLQLTPVISQMTGPVVLSLSDDLLQTQRMTIGELIEATEVCLLLTKF